MKGKAAKRHTSTHAGLLVKFAGPHAGSLQQVMQAKQQKEQQQQQQQHDCEALLQTRYKFSARFQYGK
jgi:hypothetical protein